MTQFITLTAALLAAASPAAEAPVHVAVVGFSGVGIAPETLAFDAEHFAQALRAPGLEVLTARELSTVLGLDRQKQLLGCDTSSSSCVAELAAALGAAAVVVGDVGHFESVYQVNVKVLAGTDGRLIASRSTRVGSETGVLDALTAIGHSLAAAVLADRKRPVPEELTRPAPSVRPWGWLPLGLGVAAGVAGGVLFGLSRSDAAALTDPRSMLTSTQADARRDSGRLEQTLGVAMFITAGAALLTGAGLFVFGKEPIVLTVAPGPHGAAFAFSGRLP